MKELTLQEAALAWAQGKRVEASPFTEDGWMPVDSLGSCKSNCLSTAVFGTSNCYRFRLASEPPAKHYRPWTPEEVPVGAQIQHHDWGGAGRFRYVICGVERYNVVWTTSTGPGKQRFCDLSDDPIWTHSLDNGKTWLPCGVEVDA